MTSIVQPTPPPPAFQTPVHGVAPSAMTRSESLASTDMHIPGAWVGTGPNTPAPISEDLQYFGGQLKTVPSTVQGYLPTKEGASQAVSGLKDKTAAIIPASVMNTATNILPASLQPTAGPTAADAEPPIQPTTDSPVIPTTTNTIEHKALETPSDPNTTAGTSFLDKAAAIIPAGALSAAAAYLPSALNPTANPTAADAKPPTTESAAASEVIPPTTAANDVENPSESTWTEKVLPAGALAAAGAYIPTTFNPFSKPEEAPTPSGTHEGLNGPLPPLPPTSVDSNSKPLIGSTVSQDQDVQNALANSANPEQYKVKVVPSANASTDNTSANVVSSTTAIGATTPLSPSPKEDSSNKRGERVAEGLGALGVASAGAYAVDHGLKDQKTAQMNESNPSRLIETNDSFQHVVVPATPFAGEHEQEQYITPSKREASKLDTGKKHRKDRSGSISAGEASPSSPSKSGGMFGGIRKLTKKRDRSASKGHSRDVSADDSNNVSVPPVPTKVHEDSLDTQNSNSTGESPSSPTKRERQVLHKDPPAAIGAHNETVFNDDEAPARKGSSSSTSTPGVLANPFSSNAPSASPSSPTKVGLKDKIKGEFMSVSGTIKRDQGLKEAGEKLKKGTL